MLRSQSRREKCLAPFGFQKDCSAANDAEATSFQSFSAQHFYAPFSSSFTLQATSHFTFTLLLLLLKLQNFPTANWHFWTAQTQQLIHCFLFADNHWSCLWQVQCSCNIAIQYINYTDGQTNVTKLRRQVTLAHCANAYFGKRERLSAPLILSSHVNRKQFLHTSTTQ